VRIVPLRQPRSMAKSCLLRKQDKAKGILTFAVSLSHDDRAHEDLDRSDVLERHLALCNMHAAHGRIQPARLPACLLRVLPCTGCLTLPVVWYRPSAYRRSCSLTAPGASILLPRIMKGTFESSSMESRASSSACEVASACGGESARARLWRGDDR